MKLNWGLIQTSMLLLSFLCAVDAQLTLAQIQIQKEARAAAEMLLLTTRDGRDYTDGRPQNSGLIEITAARFEQQMLKADATKRWRNAKVPASKPNPAPSPKRSGAATSTGRALLQAPVQRNLFKPYAACKLRRNKNLVGGNIPNNFINSVKKWQDCCAACYKRTDCVAWTLNNDKKKSKRGCYLKGAGYSTKDLKGYVSGTMTSTNRDGLIVSSPPPPAYEIPSPSPPTDIYTPPTDPYNQSPPMDPTYPSPSPPSDIYSRPPPPPSTNTNLAPPLPAGKGKYAEVLGLVWKFYEAQRSGPTPSWNRISWRRDSHLTDAVPGGWYDAGDYLKLNFPMAPSVGLSAWGILEFKDAYVTNGQHRSALNNLRIAADYLARCLDWSTGQYIGQIGDPNIDHDYWGRPEEEKNARPAYVYNRTMGASDLYGGVAGALASSAMVFIDNGENAFADGLLKVAVELYSWGLEKDGKYSDYYKKQTASIYKSYDFQDNMAWAGGWLYRITKNTTYLDQALTYFSRGTPDMYPGWDSVWAQHAAHMVSLANQGQTIPGIDVYRAYMDKFLRAWLVADGFEDVIQTPLGLHYPKWNEWANLAFSSSAAAVVSVQAKYNNDPTTRAAQIGFVQKQMDYILGSGYRSFVIGYGYNYPLRAHHAASSCPNMPAPCGQSQFTSPAPNPQILEGGLVAGPAGVRKSATDPDDTYHDKRSDYVTNEVANDYNAGLTTALAGLWTLL